MQRLFLNSAFEGSESFSKGSETFFLSSITQDILANLEGSHHCQLSPEVLSDSQTESLGLNSSQFFR